MTVTPLQFSLATPGQLGGAARYRRFCRAVDLEPISGGWGFLLCEDDVGDRWTLVTSDVEYLCMLAEADLSRLEIPACKFPRTRAGWPDEWAA